MRWKPIREAKVRARRPYIGPNKRQRWEFLCSKCNNWFADKETQVDHKTPTGALTAYEDIGPFIERLFCEVDGLEVLCKGCHYGKTQSQPKTTKPSRKRSVPIQSAKKPPQCNAADQAFVDPIWGDTT